MKQRSVRSFSIMMSIGICCQLALSHLGIPYYLTQLTMAAYYGLVVIGLSMLMSYAGQISIGHAAFFSIGGYTTAFLSTINLLPHQESFFVKLLSSFGFTSLTLDVYGTTLLRLSPWLAMPVAILLPVMLAALIGIPVLKLKGHYLAMATLGFGTIIYRVFLGTASLGAADGISAVPPLNLPFGLSISGSASARVSNFYAAWLILSVGTLLLLNLINSRTGRALMAMHDNEEGAASCGVDASKIKRGVFILSAFYAAFAGVMLTHYNAGIGPSEASIMKSVRYVALVAVGGTSGLFATAILSILLNFLSLRGVFGSYDDAVFGIILLAIMIFAPNGLPLKLKEVVKCLQFKRHSGR